MFKILPRYDLNLSGATDQANIAKSTGENAIASYDPTAAGSAVMKSTGTQPGGLASQLGGQTSDYVNRYTQAVANNPTVTSLYKTGNELYNVPQLATEATNLQNRLTDVTPNAYQGAKGFDIDSTDINNGIANATAYLSPQAQRATANYNTAAGLASNFVNAGITQNQMNLLPIQAEAPLLAGSENAQGVVWNTAAAQTLQGLIAKMQAGVQLSQNEMQMAQTLAQAEEAYQQEQLAQTYKTLSPSQTLFNTMNQNTFNPVTGKNTPLTSAFLGSTQ